MVSSNSSSGRISFGGVVSGIDTNSIVSQLIALQRRPIDAISGRINAVGARSNAYGSIKTAMSALLTAAAPLKDPVTFGQRSTTVGATTADVGKVTAAATNGAALQSFTFEGVALATATTAASTDAIGSAISAGVALDKAGFGDPVTAGTFSINGTTFTIAAATASKYESGIGVGASFNAATKLATAGLDLVPASGSIVINGHTVNFDVNVDSLNDVITRINSAGTGARASYDSGTKKLLLTADATGPGAITIADSNGGTLFQSMQMLNGGGGNVGVITAGTDLVSLNQVIVDINGAAIGVTATLVNDPLGRPNLLQLTSGSSVQVGSGADTSNFLSLTSLLQSPGGTTRTSTKGLGQTQQTANLVDARLSTALATSTGSFKINGVAIAWDATSDSIQNVITRINASGANVTATYDAFNDKMRLTADSMGSTATALEDVAGNFLTSSGLLGATQTLGDNASYKINGGSVRYSATNTITDAVPGVTITMNDLTAAPVKIAVNLATQAVTVAVSNFVAQYNKVTAGIRDLTKYNPKGSNGLPFGDATVQRLEGQLRSTLTGFQSGMPAGLRSLADIGLSFGAVGATVGTTTDLVMDSAKFGAKLQFDPESVAKLLTTFSGSASLDAGVCGRYLRRRGQRGRCVAISRGAALRGRSYRWCAVGVALAVARPGAPVTVCDNVPNSSCQQG